MICDLAEIYHILNYQELSPYLVAVLVLGLTDNSRVKKKISNQKLTLEQMLLAMIADGINYLCWTKTKDAQHNRNKPKSILDRLTGKDEKDDLMTFATPEEYLEWRKGKAEEWQAK